MKDEDPNLWGSEINARLDEIISYCSNKTSALDLGCGLGANSIYLAKQGFDVTSVDFNQGLIDKFKNDLRNDSFYQKIKILNENIENFLPTDKYDLILALSILHFFRIEVIKDIVNRLRESLESGGIIFIRVFSNKDRDFNRLKEAGVSIAHNEIYSSKLNKDFHYFEEGELESLLAGFDIIELLEYETHDVHPPEGGHKHWTFDVVARKIN